MTAPRPGAGCPSPARALAGALAAWALLVSWGCGDGGGALRVGFVAEEYAGDAGLRGARLGVEEAAHAGRLVRRSIELVSEEADSPGEVAEAAERLLGAGVAALVGGYAAGSCDTLAALAERAGVLFLNVGCRDEGLRVAGRRNTLHVEASAAMYDAALLESGHGAVLGHDGLARFGAAQLNERFERAGLTADPAAWAGWMAVKVLWEAASRAGSSDPAALLAYLRSEEARVDGQRGRRSPSSRAPGSSASRSSRSTRRWAPPAAPAPRRSPGTPRSRWPAPSRSGPASTSS